MKEKGRRRPMGVLPGVLGVLGVLGVACFGCGGDEGPGGATSGGGAGAAECAEPQDCPGWGLDGCNPCDDESGACATIVCEEGRCASKCPGN